MPGPSNRKKGKSQKKAAKAAQHSQPPAPPAAASPECAEEPAPEAPLPQLLPEPPSYHQPHTLSPRPPEYDVGLPGFVPQEPFIYDPGNGPRVRDARAFVDSRYFSHGPAHEDPLCAEFAQVEVLEMLKTVLPEEVALILWYNKSRLTSRICPSCRRLYHLGQVLPDLIEEEDARPKEDDGSAANPLLEREQMISGLCSPVCFILAAFDYPGAIKSAWGAMAEEMDDATWDMLNRPIGGGGPADHLKAELGLLVRMTRLHDLGLAQLCMPEVQVDDSKHNCEWGEGHDLLHHDAVA
ncbi:hypothetical protein BD626DRAFT_461778 [Schizophyllum amplum]|uniref:Uncharacterized protein n=1 Tax=Schizophyllum amplum TaxID=97359 RepID=A0A550C5R8_9AGAR|nr:hypothetical protein BD626DRAFT_461778 [Auriculariopsis ampla]